METGNQETDVRRTVGVHLAGQVRLKGGSKRRAKKNHQECKGKDRDYSEELEKPGKVDP